ncbi:MAG: CHAT domain-containing protein, partial [Cyclobacteriaceae bacterium]
MKQLLFFLFFCTSFYSLKSENSNSFFEAKKNEKEGWELIKQNKRDEGYAQLNEARKLYVKAKKPFLAYHAYAQALEIESMHAQWDSVLQHTSSIFELVKDLPLNKNNKQRMAGIAIYHLMSEAHFYKGEIKSAKKYSDEIYEKAVEKRFPKAIKDELLYQKALIRYYIGEHTSCIDLLPYDVIHSSGKEVKEKMIKLRSWIAGRKGDVDQLNQWNQEIVTLNPNSTYPHLTNAYFYISNTDLEHGEKEFKKIKFNDINNRIDISYHLYLQAAIQVEKSKYKEALKTIDNLVAYLHDAAPEYHIISLDAHYLEAYVYYLKSDYGFCETILKEILQARSNLSEQSQLLGNSQVYDLLGRVELAKNNENGANELFSKSTTIAKEAFFETSLKKGEEFNHLGHSFILLDELSKADSLLNRSERIYNNALKDSVHVLYANLYNDFGLLHQKKNNVVESITYYKKALTIYQKLLGDVHPYLSEGYYNIAGLSNSIEDYNSASDYLQRSIGSNMGSFNEESIFENPPLKGAQSYIVQLNTLIEKANTLTLKYDKDENKEFELLETAIDAYKLCSKIINKLRLGYVSDASKVILAKKTAIIFERAISLCSKMNAIKNTTAYNETALTFSETSKSGILLSVIKDAKAKKIAGIPDSLLVYEQRINLKIADLDNKLYEELLKGTKSSKLKVNRLNKELVLQQKHMATLINTIEGLYPRYYDLKYKETFPTLKEYKRVITPSLHEKEKKKRKIESTVVEYFVGKDKIYAFIISSSGLELVEIDKQERLEKTIAGMQNSLKYLAKETFLKTSVQLYNQLIRPIKDKVKTKKVIIIPDSYLSYIPFEVLVDSAKKAPHFKGNNSVFQKSKYLINEKEISYSYSLRLLQEISLNKHHSHEKNIALYAPVFDSLAVKNEDLEPILASYDEVTAINEKYIKKKHRTHISTRSEATEENFKSNSLSNYEYVHLSTHAMAGNASKSQAGVYFWPDSSKSSDNDGVLSEAEIFNLNLKANLVTLSACETG